MSDLRNSKKILYISYDGMTDPLGQSQVLPYLTGLSKMGFRFTIISCEKKAVFERGRQRIEEICSQSGINWIPIRYTKKPPILSTLRDVIKISQKARNLYKEKPFSIVHCRSYIASLIGLSLKKKYGVKFVFDMRGFWADERRDAGLWNLSNPVYKYVYRYFKKKEKQLLINADHIVSLTEAGKDEINSWKLIGVAPITVIPTSADMNLFDYHRITADQMKSLRNQLNLADDQFVLSYLGSIGTWYMLREMLLFFKEMQKQYPGSKFLLFTKDSAEHIYEVAEQLKVEKKAILIHPVERNQVPLYLSVSQISIFFIRSYYSKKASAPTKLAEIMGMGIPLICNTGVGDVDRIVGESKSGILVSDFSSEGLRNAALRIPEMLKIPKEEIRLAAIKQFSLEEAIEKYGHIYETLS